MGYGRAVLRLTATEAARHFKAVLGRVATGEEIEVVRNGAPVAIIAPPPRPTVLPNRARDLVGSAPSSGESFSDDLRALQAELKAPPDAWG
jgi:prevent-host-death family protein